MKIFTSRNWGLRLLALVLAIVIYYALSNNTPRHTETNERSIFQHN